VRDFFAGFCRKHISCGDDQPQRSVWRFVESYSVPSTKALLEICRMKTIGITVHSYCRSIVLPEIWASEVFSHLTLYTPWPWPSTLKIRWATSSHRAVPIRAKFQLQNYYTSWDTGFQIFHIWHCSDLDLDPSTVKTWRVSASHCMYKVSTSDLLHFLRYRLMKRIVIK